MNETSSTELEGSDALYFRCIGKIRSPFKTKFAVPRQAMLVEEIHSKIEFKKCFQPEFSLQGLQDFSHVWLLWHFHKSDNKSFKAKVSPPRLQGDKMGVFSTRSPHRPNPIGMSVVELVEVGTNYIWVKGADLIDKTPILDIKPYIPQYDSIPGARSGWLELVKESIDKVGITPGCLAKFQEKFECISAQKDFTNAEELIGFLSKLIQEDPRPYQLRTSAIDDVMKENFVLEIYNFELFFQIKDAIAEIIDFKVNKRK